MATTYTASLDVNCWKEHTCVNCNSVYRYQFVRKVSAQGASEEAASANLNQAVQKSLANDVDPHPCPECGLYQPDMIAQRRTTGHWILFWVGLVGLAVLLVLGLTELVSYAMIAWLAAGLLGCVLIGHLGIDMRDDNGNPDANRSNSLTAMENGALQLCTKGSPDTTRNEYVTPRFTLPLQLIYGLLAVCVLAAASPELARLASGWSLNEGWFPQVAGPGDEPYIWFPQKISSIKGYWVGQSRAEVTNAAEVGLQQSGLPSCTNHTSWGDNIRAKSSEKSSSSTLWVGVQIPKDPNLAGKTLNLRLHLTVKYPKLMGNNHFDEVQEEFSHSALLELSSANAGSQYRNLWWFGVGGGGAVTLLMGLSLIACAGRLRKDALPTNVYTVGEGEEEEEESNSEPDQQES